MSQNKGTELRDETRAALNELGESTDPRLRRAVELLHERLSLIERRLEGDDEALGRFVDP